MLCVLYPFRNCPSRKRRNTFARISYLYPFSFSILRIRYVLSDVIFVSNFILVKHVYGICVSHGPLAIRTKEVLIKYYTCIFYFYYYYARFRFIYHLPPYDRDRKISVEFGSEKVLPSAELIGKGNAH